MQEMLRKLISRRSLDREEAATLMRGLMEGRATSAQIGALLIALRMKGETVDEIAGFAREMRARAVPVTPQHQPLLDTCGTGGSVMRVFNVSTAAAFVAASAGIAVAKHGNRAMSGVCGSADVLEALGVRIDLTPEQCAECIDRVGIGFLFAPGHHPALKHVGGPRRELGVRTIFNLLGPLANPAGAKLHVMGVYDPDLCALAAGALRELGSERAVVVHAEIGIGEISTVGRTYVSELRDGQLTSYVLEPGDLGITGTEPDIADFAPAETPAANAQLLRAALDSDDRDPAMQARRGLIAVNAAAAFRVAGKADSWTEAVNMARVQITSTRPLALIEQLAAFTQSGP